MRLITRADFDGLACGALLMELGIIDSWLFVHPKDLQDGKIDVSSNDVLANVPYVPGCGLWFDHHSSEDERIGLEMPVEGACYPASSAARIIYDYYDGMQRMPYLSEMVHAVDKVDSAQLTVDDIVNPTGWVLLGFIMDPRTGLGRYRGFSKPNFAVMEDLMDACRDFSIEQLLMMPDVAERVEYYNKQNLEFRKMLMQYTTTDGEIIITDLRGLSTIQTGNRFLLYSLFPEQNISIWLVDGLGAINTVVAVGHSVLNRTSKVDVGSVMLKYGGGGHKQVGTCQVPHEDTDRIVQEIIEAIKDIGKK
ncbi:MAG: exopolyphosphatase [Defluviitaleaceae bacterium]|nr:exopolyphosphatase [Defluviitaleaceae bacterium]MCL2240344.1 exopolyphosphatase [Defluviitaleaceae bacterium]